MKHLSSAELRALEAVLVANVSLVETLVQRLYEIGSALERSRDRPHGIRIETGTPMPHELRRAAPAAQKIILRPS